MPGYVPQSHDALISKFRGYVEVVHDDVFSAIPALAIEALIVGIDVFNLCLGGLGSLGVTMHGRRGAGWKRLPKKPVWQRITWVSTRTMTMMTCRRAVRRPWPCHSRPPRSVLMAPLRFRCGADPEGLAKTLATSSDKTGDDHE